MKEIAAILAGIAPKELLVEKLQDSINEWKTNPSSDNFNVLAMASSLVSLKASMKEGADGVIEILNDLDITKRGKDLLNPSVK